MSIINIDKREVNATNRNGRINTSSIVNSSSSSNNSSSSNGISASGLTVNYLPIYNGTQLVNSTINSTYAGLRTNQSFFADVVNSDSNTFQASGSGGYINLSNYYAIFAADSDGFRKIEFIDSEFRITPDLDNTNMSHNFGVDSIYSDSYVTLGQSEKRYANLFATTINVSSGQLVNLLNADLLDGNHASAFSLVGHTHPATGTVTSIGLSLPSIFNVTNSPITTTGTLTATLANQYGGTVFAAPTDAGGVPSFRFLASSDIPALPYDNFESWGITAGGARVNIESVNSTGEYRNVKFQGGTAINVGSFSSTGNTLTVAYNVDLGAGATQAAPGNHTHSYNLPSYAIVASNASTTSLTGVDVTGLVIGVLAGAVYEYEANLMIQTNNTYGNGYGVFLSGAGTAVGTFFSDYNATVYTSCTTIANTYYSPFLVSSSTGFLSIKGILRPTANGNFSIKHKKITSGTSTVAAESYLKLTRIS